MQPCGCVPSWPGSLKGDRHDAAPSGNASNRRYHNGCFPPQSQAQDATRLGFFGPGTDRSFANQRPIGVACHDASESDQRISALRPTWSRSRQVGFAHVPRRGYGALPMRRRPRSRCSCVPRLIDDSTEPAAVKSEAPLTREAPFNSLLFGCLIDFSPAAWSGLVPALLGGAQAVAIAAQRHPPSARAKPSAQAVLTTALAVRNEDVAAMRQIERRWRSCRCLPRSHQAAV